MEHNPIPKQPKKGSAARTATAEEERSKAELEERLAAVETTLKTVIATLETRPDASTNKEKAAEKATPIQPEITPPRKPP
jgi:hypothetical protein